MNPVILNQYKIIPEGVFDCYLFSQLALSQVAWEVFPPRFIFIFLRWHVWSTRVAPKLDNMQETWELKGYLNAQVPPKAPNCSFFLADLFAQFLHLFLGFSATNTIDIQFRFVVVEVAADFNCTNFDSMRPFAAQSTGAFGDCSHADEPLPGMTLNWTYSRCFPKVGWRLVSPVYPLSQTNPMAEACGLQ